MAVIKRVITAQEREQARQKEVDKQRERDERKERLSTKAKLSQTDINELVLILAEEHGLIE
jgi:hypothetical protein